MWDSWTRACWRSVWQQFGIKELLLSLSLIVTRDSRNSVNASYDLNQRPSISLSPLKQSEEFYLCLVVCRLAVFSCHVKRRIRWCWKHFGWYYFPMIPRWDCFHLRTIVFILRGSLFWVMTSISHLTSLSLTGTNSESSLRSWGLFWISQFWGENEILGFKDGTVCSEEILKIPHSWTPPSLFSSAGRVCPGSSQTSLISVCPVLQAPGWTV